MTDARFPDRWLSDKRIQLLSDSHFRSFVNSLTWAVSNRTDGVLEDGDLQLIPRFDHSAPAAFVDSGLWADRDGDGWMITVYASTQTTAAELQAAEVARIKARDKKRQQRAAQQQRQDDSDKGDAKVRTPAESPTAGTPPEGVRTERVPPAAETSSAGCDLKSHPSTGTPAIGNLGDANEVVGNDAPRKSIYTAAFERWWERYPRKDAKRTAFEAWKRARKRASEEQLIAGADRYASDPNRELKYTKQPATWLNGDCWLSENLPGRVASSDAAMAAVQALKGPQTAYERKTAHNAEVFTRLANAGDAAGSFGSLFGGVNEVIDGEIVVVPGDVPGDNRRDVPGDITG